MLYGQCVNYIIWQFGFQKYRGLQMFFRIEVLNNFAHFTGKHLCWSLFLKLATLLKKTPTQVFFCEICKIFKNVFLLRNTLGSCPWKYLMITLSFAYQNNEWCHFVVGIGFPGLISFYYVYFVSFFLFPFFLVFCGFYYLLEF